MSDRLLSAISDAIETAASDANCCGCYSDRAAKAVMAVLLKNGSLEGNSDFAASILKEEKKAKRERAQAEREREEFDREQERLREEMFNRMDPTGARFELIRMGWHIGSWSIRPYGETTLGFFNVDSGMDGEITTDTPEAAFPTFLAEVKNGGGK